MKASASPAQPIDAANGKRALDALRTALGKDWVFAAGDQALDAYRDDYALAPHGDTRPWAAVAPGNLKQIQKVLEIARRYKLALWPLSTGRNLGYGGAAARQAGALMLDLKRMKRIIEVNERAAYAVVEPGVSYLDLAARLRKLGGRLWVDSTGSPWGGPLGNFLERGVGYTPYGQHSDTQCGLQVVLADGTVVDTASGIKARTDNLYRYSHGAWVDGLFNQSNFGIVTRIGVQLMPAPAGYRPYLVTVDAEENLQALLDALRPLSLEGLLPGRPTLMTLPRAAAYGATRAQYQTGAGPLRAQAHSRLMAEQARGYWNLYGAFYGAEALLDVHVRELQNALRAVPGARLHFADTRADDAAFKCRAALMGGAPSMDEYKTLDWVGAGAHLDFTAVLPFDGDVAQSASEAARELCHAHGFDDCAEFQLEPRALRLEIRLIFEREVVAQQRAAHAAVSALAARFVSLGHGSPRAHLAFMDDTAASYRWSDDALAHASAAIKDVLDAQGVLAPGKSALWPGRHSGRRK
ncbi:MAG: FAD-binding oxidoreductase [Gammaproteobacteria bacterium]|nr:FAD-binding oxidoreductase [Gammaproteobacteria bacterium]